MSRIIERDTVIKQGDGYTLQLETNGDLSTATALTWQARRSPTSPILLTASGTFMSTNGMKSVVWVPLTPTQTSDLGLWLYELVALVGGQPYHYPSEGFLRLKIAKSLD
jgi:hypothetical protein